MCNVWCYDFSKKLEILIQNDHSILEVGSRNVNGSLREIFEDTAREYVGVDLFDGPGVDRIANVLDLENIYTENYFDIVLSTEMLEHCFEWRDALFQMLYVLKNDGLCLITTRSPGFELHDYPSDHWRFSRKDFEKIFAPICEIVELDNDMTLGWPCGIGVILKKTCTNEELKRWRKRLEEISVHSMENEINRVSSQQQPEENERILFDQYSRYKACADLLEETGYLPENSILDIGSGPECLFGRFLPNAKITYVDPLIQNAPQKNKIVGDIFSEQLNEKSFDCVTAVDVYEHISPESRLSFLNRLLSLAKNTIILGFPTSDSSNALDVDKSIDEQYKNIYGCEYPWLEEHQKFGLPSESHTIEYLTQSGWHCQSIGHGHAPWLKKFLGFVVCSWEISNLKEIILDASDIFNQNLYALDYTTPHYRQFIIATRTPLATIKPPVPKINRPDGELIFHNLLDEMHMKCHIASLLELKKRDEIALKQQELVLKQQNETTVLSDKITAQQNELLELKNQIKELKQSRSWRLTRPMRVLLRLLRYGGTKSDYQQFSQTIRYRYHQLPLSAQTKKNIRSIYHLLIRKVFRPLHYLSYNNSKFTPPELTPINKHFGIPDYIIWGVIDWHFRHQRPQQLALELANKGRRIFYISPILVDSKYPGFDAEAIGNTKQIYQIKLHVNNVSSIYDNAPSNEAILQLRQSLGEVLIWGSCQNTVSLVNHPFWYDAANVIPNNRLIFDCMDHHEGFGNNGNSLLASEKQLLASAELTIVTSEWLRNAVSQHSKECVVIRNAGDFEFFSRVPSNIYRDPEGKQIIGYYGAIAEWFDLELIKGIATQLTDSILLLVGADTINARSTLSKIKNIVFVGEVPYSKLPFYLYSFDVCLLPFKITPLTMATNPVKIYEYLSAGKPVVSVELPEITQFTDLVYSAPNHDEFISTVIEVLNEPEPRTHIQQRQTFAAAQTWKHRAETLVQKIETSARDPKVSIVIVTYNNINLTRICLESLLNHTQYDALEIIVVDNASSDGSPQFLSEWASKDSKRTAILNTENLGFAAANNQGLEAASGEYLVLLNNDTYVTPGWVRTLINYIKNDPTIGLIGPVTNNIGNEAKIDISYDSMEEMLLKSAAYTRRHIGRTYPLRTAAFFCVMMARTTYNRVGKLDEAFGVGFFEDDDYCRRIEKLGLRIVCAEDVFIHHHLSASFNKLKQEDRRKLFEKNKTIYESKWGTWIPHRYRSQKAPRQSKLVCSENAFPRQKYLEGLCIICGKQSQFFYEEPAMWRETLNCQHCRSTSRYRSIAKGILRAISELSNIEASSLPAISNFNGKHLNVYDTQPPFYYELCAYPIPDLLKNSGWIDVALSQYKPKMKMGETIRKGITNQNLESLTYPSESLDIIITSDVMEHVRLDYKAHREIYRVLKPGGIYLFTVPHDRSWEKTLIRVQISDPTDPSKDIHLLEPEYHGDTNNDNDAGVLAYRTYGKDLETFLINLGFEVEYSRGDYNNLGIMNTELYYCRKIK